MKMPDKNLVLDKNEEVSTFANNDIIVSMVLSSMNGKTAICEIADKKGFELEHVQKIAKKLIDENLVRPLYIKDGRNIRNLPLKETDNNLSPPSTGTDLAKELSDKVESLYNKISQMNYYDLFDLDPNFSRAELSKKYVEISKQFHPDRAFGPNKIDLGKKMEFIFKAATGAYEILSNPQNLAVYTSSIKDELELRRIEKQLKNAVNTPSTQPTTVCNVGFKKIKIPRTTVSKNNNDEKKIRISKTTNSQKQKRNVRVGLGKSDFSPDGSKITKNKIKRKRISVLPASRKDSGVDWRKQRAGRAMAVIMGKTPSAAPCSPKEMEDILKNADLALENQQYKEAVQFLIKGENIDPMNATIKKLKEKALAGLKESESMEFIRKGRFQLKNDDLVSAMASFQKALEIYPDSIEARYYLTKVMMKTRTDLPQARTYIMEVIKMGGQRSRYFDILGDMYLLTTDKEKARKAFEKALADDPENKTLIKKLNSCR